MGKQTKTEDKRDRGKDLELVKDFLGPHAFLVSKAMVDLATAVEAVLNQHNAALLAEIRVVCNEILDAADEALRASVSPVQ